MSMNHVVLVGILFLKLNDKPIWWLFKNINFCTLCQQTINNLFMYTASDLLKA